MTGARKNNELPCIKKILSNLLGDNTMLLGRSIRTTGSIVLCRIRMGVQYDQVDD